MTSHSWSAAKALFILVLITAALPVASAGPAFGQQSPGNSLPVSSPLITQLVDESLLTVLKGNTHPLARPEFDLGTAPATLPMQRMLLVLKRSREQESALRKLLDDQQDKHSPSFHKWLTPEAFGRQFGPADADLAVITAWLQSQGFQVGSTKGRTVLEFSGSARQVQEAFHTTIHKYLVNSEQHWANSSDPSIPAALTPAVTGVLTLHNFLKKPTLHFTKEAVPAKLVTNGKKRQVTFPSQSGQPAIHALGPQDYATIYNSPAFEGGVTGAGIIIGVVARSNLFNLGLDPQDFGELFGCCDRLQIVLNGPDPGDLGGGEEAEATLDATWSGAVGFGATEDLVISATTNTTDGTDLSEVYIIENNLADIMTESFSSCELFATDTELAGASALAEQAAAQGITYFVSAGDDGAEGCDDPNTPPASFPVSVNLLASTAFNVAVGGTMFNENGQDSSYWGSEPPVTESAISYIPENVWNESSLTAGLWSGSGGASGGNLQSGGTTAGVPKPSWQAGVSGIPTDGVRDLPDISLTAAGHDPYILCLDGSCEPDSQGNLFVYFVGGTSASAPSFASLMALVDQQMGGRQGQANYVLYRLAASENASLAQCNGSSTSVLPATTCIFNDVTVGNNAVPGEINFGLSNAQYQAGVGYDLATGLGSVNITNLVNQWNSVTFNPTTTTLTLSPLVNITHGSSVTVTISVAPNSGTGHPSGDVSLLAFPVTGSTALGDFTLSGTGTVASSTRELLGGSYEVSAHYAGDVTYAASDSNQVLVTVTPESSTTTASVLTFDANGNQFNFTGGPFGSFVYLRADVAGVSGNGTPTGTVTFNDTFGAIPGGGSFPLNSGDQFQNGSNTATPNGVFTFDTGTHTISASYSGDASFNPSTSASSLTFTIQPGMFATVPSSQAFVILSAPGASGSTSVNVSSSTGFNGTIALSCSGLPTGAACAFSPASIKASGVATTTSSTIAVTTTAAAALLHFPVGPSSPGWLAMAGFMLFSVVLVGASGHRRSPLFLLALLALVISVPGCGGGGSSSPPPPPPPPPSTAAGTYNIAVTATSGSATSTTGFTLVVQ